MSAGVHRVQIADPSDPRLADYQDLKDATLARRRGRFIVEGRGNLGVLLTRSRLCPESILLSERADRSLLESIDRAGPDCPVYVAPQATLAQIVGFPFHRGCLAVCVRPEPYDPVTLAARLEQAHRAPRLLVLEGLRDHDNVGGIFRNAMALGGHGVILCPETCDPLYRKAIRTSMGGSLCLPFARAARWPGLLRSLREQGYLVVALDPGADVTDLDDALSRVRGCRPRTAASDRPIALLLGTEGAGLSCESLAEVDAAWRIDMASGVDSLNVSVAAGIALHTLRSKARLDGAPPRAADLE